MVDKLTEDGDDEQQLDKAERAAERKATKRRKKWAESALARQAPWLGSTLATMEAVPSNLQAIFQLARRLTASAICTADSKGAWTVFSCKEMGHLCAHFPRIAGGSAANQRKWYPVFNTTQRAVCEAAQNLCMESVDGVGDEIVNSERKVEAEVEFLER